MDEYIVTGQIWVVVSADSKEDAIKTARYHSNWEDWDWYEQDAELYEERQDVL